MKFELHHGDCLDVLKTLADCSVDAIVTDPPYGLSFMGKRWDYDVPTEAVWVECLRVLKPGGHLLAFAGTRTQHRMAVRIEDAGFEIRDMIAWVYGSGFPKSLDVSKAIDKAAGAEREVIGMSTNGSGAQPNKLNNHTTGDTGIGYADGSGKTFNITAPATEAAKQWEGWGTALKPALEPITLARKPLIGTVAANVLEHGTGGLNVDGCRIGTEGATKRSHQEPYGEGGRGDQGGAQNWRTGHKIEDINAGRWPANFIHDGSEEVLALFPETTSGSLTGQPRTENKIYGSAANTLGTPRFHEGDSGSAARFFYCAKASRDDRDEGCGALELTEAGIKNDSGRGFSESDPMAAVMRHNPHPTVKPTDLMRYLCRLITPPGGIVLDPFTGSGSTGKAAMAEGFRFIGIEREAEYIEIARARISAEAEKPRQLSLF
jgi:site-specific DNA-methyltransferase (adenine-specific)